MLLQKATGMSDRSVMLLIKFIIIFLTLLAEVLVLDELRELACIIPKAQETVCKQIGLQKDDFEQYAVCPECHAIYAKSDVTSGRISRCTFVRWPLHPHQSQRSACNTILHAGTKTVPLGIFCFRPISQYLQGFVLQENFIKKCNLWRNRPTRNNYMADVYDGSHWKSEIPDYLSSQTSLYGMINIDWFQPYKHTQHSIGARYVVLLNLPRAERFKEENVMLVGLLPGPSEPKLTVNTYLSVIIEDLLKLDRGIEMNDSTPQGNNLYRFRILSCASDLPATRKLGGFLSFSANSGKLTRYLISEHRKKCVFISCCAYSIPMQWHQMVIKV